MATFDEKVKQAIETIGERVKAAVEAQLKLKGLLSLEFVDVTGTKDKDGTDKDTVSIKMTTGSTHTEGYCYYKVNWHRKIVISTGIDKTETKEEDGKGTLQFALNIQNARFIKKMYSPNEILVEVQMMPGSDNAGDIDGDVTYTAKVDKDVLEASFINKKVILRCEGKLVCNDYYIHEIIPVYKKDTMYITFRIFSPDKVMTVHEYCRSFLSKKLWSEIVDKELKNFKLPYADEPIQKNADNSKFIRKCKNPQAEKKEYQEHIFPYLVQYNESFYDFLKRTTNRWGEFLYYEDGKLNIGYDESGTPKDYKDDYSSLTYQDLTKDNKAFQPVVGDYFGEAPSDSQILKNTLTKGGYDVVKGEINSLGDTSIGGDTYVMKKMGKLLTNDKTIWGFLVDQGVEDGLSYATAQEVSNDKNKAFDNAYFNKKDKKNVRYDSEQYNGDKEYNEFSEFNPILTSEKYAEIAKKEVSSGRNAAVVDFDTNYPDIKLGQIIQLHGENYLVVQVEGYQPEMMKIVNNKYFVHVVDTEKVVYKVTAIPENKINDDTSNEIQDKKYYPSVLETGHVRRCGPQLAKVVDNDDPLRLNRVRVKFNWQAADDEPTPWLMYATPANTSKAGIHGRHYKDEYVLVDYVNGNMEHPYVTGAIIEKAPAPLNTNDIVYMTPTGTRMTMSDGTGAGMTAWWASMNPAAKLIQGFYPTGNLLTFDKSRCFEGNIELRDAYGTWSIKGCTDERSVSVKSLWGDVKIDAFTGITISAPNGDVKIKGKNVSIEAGCNLTLSSGKNIKNKFAWNKECGFSVTAMLANLGSEIAKKLATKVASLIDLTVLRHVVEIVVKPVEGKLSLEAGRYLMLGSGGVKPDYPVDAYKKPKTKDDKEKTNRGIKLSFERANTIISSRILAHKSRYRVGVRKRAALGLLVTACKNANGEAQCKTIDEIIQAMWNNPDMDKDALKNAIGFKGVYQDLGENDEPSQEQINLFSEYIRDRQNPEHVKKTVRGCQQAKIKKIVRAAQLMQEAVKAFKQELDNFDAKVTQEAADQTREFDFVTVKRILVKNNLPDCYIKNYNGDDAKDIRLFKADNNVLEAPIKTIRRKIFMAMVDAFGFERSAVSTDPLKAASVPSAPAPDCTDDKWREYVSSIQVMPVKKEDDSWLKKTITDPMLAASGIDGWKNVYDDFAFGSSKNGKILFGSQDGTLVLERNIYRANVDHNDIPQEDQAGVVRNYVDKVREIMSQA